MPAAASRMRQKNHRKRREVEKGYFNELTLKEQFKDYIPYCCVIYVHSKWRCVTAKKNTAEAWASRPSRLQATGYTPRLVAHS